MIVGGLHLGTLIHTKNGLVPVENIKIGDWILSFSNEKNSCYKQVTKTLSYVATQIFLVAFYPLKLEDRIINNTGLITTAEENHLIITGEHKLFERSNGWQKADQLYIGQEILLIDETIARVAEARQIFITLDPNYGWTPDPFDTGLGCKIKLDKWTDSYLNLEYQVSNDQIDHFNSENSYKTTVYSLTIDDDSTYAVGSLGALSQS